MTTDQASPGCGPLMTAVLAPLRARGVEFELADGGTVVRFAVALPRATYRVLVLVDEAQYLCVCWVYFPAQVPAELMLVACETIARANWGLTIGAFELDFRDGEIRFRTGVDVEGGELAPAMADALVRAGLAANERYYGAFMEVFFGGGSPAEAIAVADAP